MYRRHVISSDINSVGYENNTLEIEFNSGGIYQYHGVPENKYNGLLSAGSCGRYFHTFIKPYYKGIRIG